MWLWLLNNVKEFVIKDGSNYKYVTFRSDCELNSTQIWSLLKCKNLYNSRYKMYNVNTERKGEVYNTSFYLRSI